MAEIREYEVQAGSTETFGRTIAGCRNHRFVVDGPVQNGCPGEEVTPAELFLAGVAACGVELVQVIARDEGIEVEGVSTTIVGTMDPANRVREDVNVFNAVRLYFELRGVGDEDAAALVEAFKAR